MSDPDDPELPVPEALDDWCAAVRTTILPYARTAQGLRPWTRPQQRKLMALWGEITPDRDERLAMGNYILKGSGLTRQPLTSFAELSEAQASGLITVLFGPESESNMALEDSYLRLTEVLARVRSKRP